jgi:Ulp1 family protease
MKFTRIRTQSFQLKYYLDADCHLDLSTVYNHYIKKLFKGNEVSCFLALHFKRPDYTLFQVYIELKDKPDFQTEKSLSINPQNAKITSCQFSSVSSFANFVEQIEITNTTLWDNCGTPELWSKLIKIKQPFNLASQMKSIAEMSDDNSTIAPISTLSDANSLSSRYSISSTEYNRIITENEQYKDANNKLTEENQDLKNNVSSLMANVNSLIKTVSILHERMDKLESELSFTSQQLSLKEKQLLKELEKGNRKRDDNAKYEISSDEDQALEPEERRLSERDLEMLGKGQWLNDKLINEYISLIKARKKEVRHVSIQNTYFMQILLQEKDIKSLNMYTKDLDRFLCRFQVYPINFHGNHWGVILLNLEQIEISGKLKTYYKCNVTVLDSLNIYHEKNMNNKMITSLFKKLYEEFLKGVVEPLLKTIEFVDIKYKSTKLSEQVNSHDCGVFILEYIECILNSHKKLTYENLIQCLMGIASEDKSEKREMLYECLKNV